MKTALNKVLMTATFMTVVSVAMPAMASTSILCSVRASNSSANYQAGVDANGNPVAPADVSAAPKAMPETVRIPLTLEVADRMNEVLPANAKLEANVGTVEVRQDGHVIINGMDMTAPATDMCSAIEKQKEAAMKTQDRPKKPKKKRAPKPLEVAPEAAAAPTESSPTEAAPTETAPAPEAAAPQVLEPAPSMEVVPAADTLAPPVDPMATAPAPESASPVLADPSAAPVPPPTDEQQAQPQ